MAWAVAVWVAANKAVAWVAVAKVGVAWAVVAKAAVVKVAAAARRRLVGLRSTRRGCCGR